jgi:hypothetical protein
VKLLDNIMHGKWEVRRTIWPYKEGYGVYHPRQRVILSTGLTKEQAQAECDSLNAEEKNSVPVGA